MRDDIFPMSSHFRNGKNLLMFARRTVAREFCLHQSRHFFAAPEGEKWRSSSNEHGRSLVRPSQASDVCMDASVLSNQWHSSGFAYWLSGWAFLEVLEYLGTLSLLVALFLFSRAVIDEAKHYQAWPSYQFLTGKRRQRRRIDALESCMPTVSTGWS